MEFDPMLQPVACRIGSSNFQRGGRNVGCVNLGVWQLFGKSQRNAARTGADVDDAQGLPFGARSSYLGFSGRGSRGGSRSVRAQQFQRGFDQVFGFWPRNQNGWADDEVHAPKFLMPSNVLCRNTAGAFIKGDIITA